MVRGLTFSKDMVIVSTSNESQINSSDQLSHNNKGKLNWYLTIKNDSLD